MPRLRRHRLITVFVALFSLLFTQLAVAGYACPANDKLGEAIAMAQTGMPCAGEMMAIDTEQPGLCHAHCQPAQQTADKVQVPAPAAAMAPGFAYAVKPVHFSAPDRPAQAPLLLRSTAPPIAVRHCCFRI